MSSIRRPSRPRCRAAVAAAIAVAAELRGATPVVGQSLDSSAPADPSATVAGPAHDHAAPLGPPADPAVLASARKDALVPDASPAPAALTETSRAGGGHVREYWIKA